MVTNLRMAEALAIQRMLGENGPLWITERIGALTAVGDADGVERFKQIGASYQELLAQGRH